MPTLDTDRHLVLDSDDHAALLAARIAERDATILAKDAERKRARAAKDGKATKLAEDAKAAKLAEAATEEGKFKASVAAVKAKHAATDLVAADEGHEIGTGRYVLKAGPLLQGFGPIIDKRLPLTDAQCDAWVASYRVSVRAGFEAQDLQRQVSEYEAAHPPIDGEPGHLIPEPQTLQDLRAALAAKVALARTEQGKQAAIVAAVYAAAGEDRGKYTYWHEIDVEAGEIVLGRNPMLTTRDVVGPVG